MLLLWKLAGYKIGIFFSKLFLLYVYQIYFVINQTHTDLFLIWSVQASNNLKTDVLCADYLRNPTKFSLSFPGTLTVHAMWAMWARSTK